MHASLIGSSRLSATMCCIAAAIWITPARADDMEAFFKGKVLSLITSVQEGSPGTDTVARTVGRYMTNYLPGKPSIVVKNMPGAGHVRAANFLSTQATKDGTSFGLIWPAYVMHQVVDGRGAQYDAAKFLYIGSTGLSNSTVAVWHEAGVKSIEDARKREVVMGGTGVGSDTVLYPELLNRLLGTKFKIVMGYKGAADIDIAMQRSEIEGRAGSSISALNTAGWIKDQKVNVLVQIGEKPEPGYEAIPMLTSFAKDQRSRDILQVFSYSVALGRPFLAPPGTPDAQLAALRTAFDKAVADAELVAEFKKARLDLAPLTGGQVKQLVDGIVNVDKEVLVQLKSIFGDTEQGK